MTETAPVHHSNGNGTGPRTTADVGAALPPATEARIPAPRRESPAQPLATPNGRAAKAPVRVLFDDQVRPSASTRTLKVRRPGTGYLPYRYRIADVVTVGSEIRLPELEFFRTPWLGRDLDIVIRVGKVGPAKPHGRARLFRFTDPAGVRYEEHLGRAGANFAIDMGERIEVTISTLLARSPHVAYTNILEALLRFEIAASGGMLLHSACVELDGTGVMLSARTDTGKTGTVLRLLREHGARFLSDDMTVIWPDGQAQAFPKPLTISSHTLRAVDPGDLSRTEWLLLGLKSRLHSKGGRGVGMAMGRQNLPIMTANALTQLLVPPPKYVADRLVECDIIPRTKVSHLFIIERGLPSLTDIPVETAVQELVENTDDAYGFPPYRYLAPVIEVAGQEYQSLQIKERGVLRDAVSSMRVRRLVSDNFGWADQIPNLLQRGSGQG